MPKKNERKDTSTPRLAQESRVDFFSPEWEKKTRVDFANSGKPLPESPLVTLKPHTQNGKNTRRESGTNRADSNR